MLNCGGKLLPLESPKIMGILNINNDSFFDGGKYLEQKTTIDQVQTMIESGADIIDIGAVSTRPNADEVSAEEEWKRLSYLLPLILKEFPETIFSIDTQNTSTAKAALDEGVRIINDISANRSLMELASLYKVPYVLMHMQGTPKNMQHQPTYNNVSAEVFTFFINNTKIDATNTADIIYDVGFGFGKTLSHNFQLAQSLHSLKHINAPILAGISRKRMVQEVLQVTAQDALNGTTALHSYLLQQGVDILRVHDVKEAKQSVQIFNTWVKHINGD